MKLLKTIRINENEPGNTWRRCGSHKNLLEFKKDLVVRVRVEILQENTHKQLIRLDVDEKPLSPIVVSLPMHIAKLQVQVERSPVPSYSPDFVPSHLKRRATTVEKDEDYMIGLQNYLHQNLTYRV